MTYKLRHKKTGLFYRSQTSRNGVTTNLHKEGKIYTFKPTARGRGYYYYALNGKLTPMDEKDWEAVEHPLSKWPPEGFGEIDDWRAGAKAESDAGDEAREKVRSLKKELAAMTAKRDALADALREISEGKGRFSKDPLTHASNTIEDMCEIARAAINPETRA